MQFYRTEIFFSEIETDILHLIALYYTYDDIAEALHKPKNTVRSHISNIMRKTNLYKYPYLIRYAHEHNYGKREVSA